MTILLDQKCTFVECKNMMDQFYRIINNNNNNDGSIWEGRKKEFFKCNCCGNYLCGQDNGSLDSTFM